MEATQKVTAKRKTYFDYSLLFVVLFLTAFGLVMIYSTTAYSDTYAHEGNAFYSVVKQGKIAIVSVVIMLVVSRIDYHNYMVKLTAVFIYIIAVGLCAATLLFGSESNGAQRWLTIGGHISLQTAEIAKIALIMSLAFWCDWRYKWISSSKGNLFLFISCAIITLIPTGLVVGENLSSGFIIFMIGYLMTFCASRPKWVYIILLVGGAALVIIAWNSGILPGLMHDYQVDRIEAWLNPEKYAVKESYQILQGLYAVGSGGLFGKGLGSSIQKLDFLPEAQNDMIFAIICEELGLFGAIMVIALFAILIWRLMIIASSAPDFSGSMLATGVMIHIGIQVILNICVVTNICPNTGISLPFISNGGSSLMFLMAEIGIILNVSGQIRVK